MRDVALLAMVSLVACSAEGNRNVDSNRMGKDSFLRATSAFHAPSSQAGLLALTAGELRFTACGARDAGTRVRDVRDSEGVTLVRSFRGGDGSIPVMLRLEGDSIAEIRYASPEESCDRLPPDGEIEARGNEPFWAVQVDADSARLRVPLMPDGVVFTHGAWRRLADSAWAYEARRGEGNTSEFLELQLTETRCFDSMSGARYSFKAALVREGNPATGCAVEGRRAR